MKYRLFSVENSPYTIEHAKEDAVCAMRLICAHAEEWNIDEDRIGIMGFSGGGELVNMIAYENFPGNENDVDPVERYKANPNFQIQIYPGPLGIPTQIEKNAIPAFLLTSNRDQCCSARVVQLRNA